MRFGWHVVLTKDTAGRVADTARFWSLLETYANRIVGPSDSVELLFTRSRTLSTQTLMTVVNTITLVNDVLEAQAAGLDGVVLAASIDPGVYEARSIARIPVVGSIESALAISGFIGQKAGIVTIAGGADPASYARTIEQNASRYGCRDKLIANRPVRALDQSWQEFYRCYSDAVSGNGDAFLSAFDATARELVRDGADVVICGNQLFGAVLDHYGQLKCTSNNVPLIDNTAAGLKMLQVLNSLRMTTGLDISRAGVFQSPSHDSTENVARMLGTLSGGIIGAVG